MSAIDELIEIIDYLAPPSPEKGQPWKRARCGADSPARWDGGKQWTKTDKWIAKTIRKVKRKK